MKKFAFLIVILSYRLAVAMEMNYILDTQAVIGGIKEGTITLGNLMLSETFGETDSYLYSSLMATHGSSPTNFVGDRQYTSNIDTGGINTLTLYEFYYQKSFFDQEFSLLFGMRDLSLEMNINDPALFFVHSSAGTSAELGTSGVMGPSIFPFIGPALRILWNVNRYFSAKYAMADGVPNDPNNPYGNQITLSEDEGFFSIGEIAFEKSNDWKVGAGIWSYSEKMGKEKSEGSYFMADYKFSPSFYPFFRYGLANPKAQAIHSNLVFGFIGENPYRTKDTFGFMASTISFGENYKASKPHESAYEASYLFSVSEEYQLMPLLQHIKNPSGSSVVEDATVIGLRLYINYII